MERLIAIDGNSLLHRAYYALPAMTAADGTPTGALHGFFSMLLKLVSEKPDYLAVAFDMHGPTFRHETYEAYKAGRKETPDDLRTQFPMLRELLKKMGIAVLECPAYEADDILGTLSAQCEEAGVDALLVTGDRDALQLVGPHTHVLMTRKGITDTLEYTTDVLHEAYGLSPDRMRDLKGLMGDSSDNIPGVPGVGEKTALKLLMQYASLDSVLAHADEIPGKLGERVRENADSALMSYRIGTICRQAPIECSFSDCRFEPQSMAVARDELLRLELRAIASRLPAADVSDGSAPEADAVIKLSNIVSIEALVAFFATVPADGTLAVTYEPVISFSFEDGSAYLIEPVGDDLFASAPIDPETVWNAAKRVLSDQKVRKLVFDQKRLRHLLDRYGVPLEGEVFDVMIADYLLNAVRPAGSLGALIERRSHVPAVNAAYLMCLAPSMLRELEQAGMLALYRDMELPLSGLLYDMEREGFRVDADVLLALNAAFETRITTLTESIYELAGSPFSILSPKQLGEVLFQKLGLATQRKNKTGYSTDAETLEKLSDAHPIVPMVLEYRFLSKLKSTFIEGLLQKRNADSRIRTQFNQCVTATGRISSTEPNLQNIPVRTELGREIRKAFVASPGCRLVGADYSQIELRLLAHISGDAGMIRAFQSGEDIHRITAGEVFGVQPDQVTQEMRSAAKAVNFGIVYGISDFGLARNLNIPVRQAGDYIKAYLNRYPGVQAFMRESVETGKARGYAVTLFGRRRALPELASGNYNTRSFGERVAMNMPIQGSAADIIKLAMVRVHRALKNDGLGARLVLQIHDELIVDTPNGEVERVCELLKACMEHVCELKVPLVADVRTGQSWFDTK